MMKLRNESPLICLDRRILTNDIFIHFIYSHTMLARCDFVIENVGRRNLLMGIVH